MIRQIGKGSYGEVWLGRGVTGALRAIKVVSRADFEYDRTFEREFEGIKKFEPISRTHPGLVDILHVGRNLTEGFYYYVMELADDRLSGRDIVPELYVPRTLSSDIKEKGQIPVDACAEWGAMMADALDHMHAGGLAHRDVKPSNIIFVDGVPKLADIGLVAMSGQRTFVGTEGFVPPEGPGEPGADIYSLGMVLYETSTGMDRLDFPAVPQLTGDELEKKKWRRLNGIVCKACAPSPKQRYSSARDMKSALRSLGAHTLQPPSFGGKLLRTLVFSGLLGAAIVGLRDHDLFAAYDEGKALARSSFDGLSSRPAPGPDVGPQPAPPEPPPNIVVPPIEPDPPAPEFGSVKIVTVPPGATVFLVGEGGEKVEVGNTNGNYIDARVPPGEVAYELVLDGYKNLPDRGFVEAGKTLVLGGEMQFYQPPVVGEPWTNSKGMEFYGVEDRHVSAQPIPAEVFERYLELREGEEGDIDYDKAVVLPEGSEDENGFSTVRVSRQVARDFFGWLTVDEEGLGYLAEDQYYSLDESVRYEVKDVEFGRASGLEERYPLFAVVRKANFASLEIDSQPRGAGIYIDGEYRGTTKVDVPGLRPGEVEVTVRLAGYRQRVEQLVLEPGQNRKLEVTLVESQGVVFGRPWTNGMGMELLPLGEGVMMGAHEVRVGDLDAYCAANKREPTHRPDFEQAPDHPAVLVHHRDAVAFCAWLTERERGEGLIDPSHEYRLPTDREWSRAAGLDLETGADPAARDGAVRDVFPWGDEWPPPAGAANVADKEAASWINAGETLPDYDDGFAQTSPVGSFSPNGLGFYDLGGNVWEWVAEPYGGKRPHVQGLCRRPWGRLLVGAA